MKEHSDEAKAAWSVIAAERWADQDQPLMPAWFSTGFAAGRASRPFGVADRERVQGAVGNVLANAGNYPSKVVHHILGLDMGPLIEKTTDAVLALSPTQLTSTREALAQTIEIAMADYEANGFVLSKSEFAATAADHLFSSGVLVERGVVEAEAIEIAVEEESVSNRYGDRERLLARAVSKREGNGQ